MKVKSITLTITTLLSASVLAHGDHAADHHHDYNITNEGDGYMSEAGWVSNVDIEANLWNPRGKSDEQLAKRAKWLAEQYNLARTPEQKARAAEAKAKFKDAIVINSIMPSSVGVVGQTEKHFASGLKRNKDAGMTLTSATIFAFPDKKSEMTVYDVADASEKVIKQGNYVKVDTAADIYRAKKEGNLAVMFNTQGADYVVGDLQYHAAKSYGQGIRTMGFVYNLDNELAGGGTAQSHGLTELGKQWVVEAQQQGIVVDVSHASNQTAIDAAKVATKPVMATHSNSQTLLNVGRNLSDEAAIAIAETGGVVCPTGVGMFLNKELDASPERYIEHVIHFAELIGKDKVCFSTDYVYNIEDYYANYLSNTTVYPPEKGFGSPVSNIAPENIWDVAALLEDKYGWSEEEVRGFLGENLMRVYEANWK